MNKPVRKGDILTAVDIGSSHIRVLAADVIKDGMALRGVSEIESRGIREGKVVDIEQASESLSQALKETEIMSGGRRAGEVTASVSGEHVEGCEANGSAVIGAEEVEESDISKVKEMARAEIDGKDAKRVIEILERSYVIDDSKGVRRPQGMSGRKISGDMHLIVASRNDLANLEKCVLLSGVSRVRRFVFSGLAAATAVLSEDEKELGVCLADIGAGTTDIVVYMEGMVWHTSVVAIAGDDVHRDIAQMHHASLAAAKKAKHDIGLADRGMAGEEFAVLQDASGGGENKVGREVVRDTIGYRVDEILEHIELQLAPFRSEGRKLSAGVVLVGDGALLPGLETVAGRKLSLPVRVGLPRYRGEMHDLILQPRFAVGVGLLQLMAARRREEEQDRADMGWWDKMASAWKNAMRDE